MNYLSLFSGIEAASVAWKPLGWKAVGFSEIEKFPCAVLSHHYPEITNYGDVTNYKSWNINERVGFFAMAPNVGACRSAPMRLACVEGRILASVCCTPPLHSLNR